MIDLERVNRAIFFAVKAHEGQKMKFPSDVDYSAHIFGVALTALNFAENEKVDKNLILMVALLHDVLEDTNVSYEEIKDAFGEEVAEGVSALTKNGDISKKLQMEDCLNRILLLKKKEVAIVKLADRCFNTRCRVGNWSAEKQNKYLIEAKTICEKIGFYCPPLKNKILENISKIQL